MKKALAVAALLGLAGAAQAQVTIYGLIDMSVGKNELLGETSAQFHSGGDNYSQQGNSTSRIGFKGTTVVAPGVKANFQLETAGIGSDGSVGAGPAVVNGPTGAAQPFFNRQAWAGFSGAYGEVRLGKQDSVAFQTMLPFDFNGASNAASAQNNSGAATFAPGRVASSLQYISNDLGGLKIQAGLQLKGDTPLAKDSFALGVTYTAGPLAVAYTGETKRVEMTSTGGDTYNFNSVAGSYDFGLAKVMLGYADGGPGAKGTTLGITAPVAGVNVGAMFTRNSDYNTLGSELFVNKEIFKGTYAYFDYGNVDKFPLGATTTSSKNTYALGVIYTF